jgi:hypothetical protein
MTRLILHAGRQFGRFAVLLFALPAFGIFLAWLLLLDSYPAAVLVTGIVVIPMTMMGIALLIGTLFAGFRRAKVDGVPKKSAHGLWTLWETVAGKKRADRTTIILSSNLNASVSEERLLFGLLGRRLFLTLGIPLLAVTDEKALAAILAHEDAHVRNRDTNGGLNLAEFANSFEVIFDYAPPGETVTGSLFYLFLGRLTRSLEQEETRLSREAEIKADRHSAQTSDPEAAARALLLIAAADQFFKDRVYDPLEHELLGAMSPPRPPLERLLEAAKQLSTRDLLHEYAHKAVAAPDDAKSDHPPWSERLGALGYAEIPAIESVVVPALTLVNGDFAAERIREFDRKWTSDVADYLDR